MTNPYKILNLDPSSSEEAVRAQYALLKARYSEERFLSGTKGNEAADKLTELEIAFKIIEDDFAYKKNAAQNGTTQYDFSFIAKLIENGKYNDAQIALDNINYHNAEWHYTQAMLFYRREWTSEAKAQLKMALQQEPNNQKYLTALERLQHVMGNPRTNPQNLGNQQHPQGVPLSEADRICGPCAQCCACAMCAQCCCTCPMGGSCDGRG